MAQSYYFHPWTQTKNKELTEYTYESIICNKYKNNQGEHLLIGERYMMKVWVKNCYGTLVTVK